MAEQLKCVIDAGGQGATISIVETTKPPTTGGIGIMAIFTKLLAIYQAIKAGDWGTVAKLVLELVALVSTATPAEHAEAEAAMQQVQAAFAAAAPKAS